MDELEEIRKRKLSELRAAQLEKIQQQAKEEEQLQQQIEQLEITVKQVLTKEALQRYGNLKAAFPDRAVQLLVILAQALQAGQINKIDDDTLKEILKKKELRLDIIKRELVDINKKYGDKRKTEIIDQDESLIREIDKKI